MARADVGAYLPADPPSPPVSYHLDLARWPRRPAFEFFRTFDRPFFNVTAPVEVGPLVEATRSAGLPFTPALTYLALRAANEEEPFRYRLDGDGVLVHEVVHGSQTELVEGERLAFCYADYGPTFAGYLARLEAARRRLRAAPGREPMDARPDRTDLLYLSSLPWVAFTSISHAHRLGGEDSVPRVVFGRYERRGERTMLPVSVEVHHALMDGLHVGRFFERLGALCADPRVALGLPTAPPTPPPDANVVDGLLDFLRRVEPLKSTLRSGHTASGRRESVAAHAWRFALMAFALRDQFPDADPLRLLGMALVHDLGESVSGDIPAPEQVGTDKAGTERRDLAWVLAPLPEATRAELLGLYDEYEAAETPTARAAKGLDKLETILQHTQGDNPPGFDYRFNLGYGRRYTGAHPTLRALRERLDEETARRVQESEASGAAGDLAGDHPNSPVT